MVFPRFPMLGFPMCFHGFRWFSQGFHWFSLFFCPPKKDAKNGMGRSSRWFLGQAPEEVQCGRSTSSRDRHLIDFKAGPGAPGSESDLRHNGRLLIITLRVVKLKHWRTVNQGYLDSPIDPHDVLPIWGILRWKTQETQTRWGMVRLQTIDGRWVQPFFWRPRNCHIANIIYWIWYHHYIA